MTLSPGSCGFEERDQCLSFLCKHCSHDVHEFASLACDHCLGLTSRKNPSKNIGL